MITIARVAIMIIMNFVELAIQAITMMKKEIVMIAKMRTAVDLPF